MAMNTIRNAALTASLWLMAASGHAEVLLIAETGFITENKIQLSTDRETTWNAFVQVGQWWPADHTRWGARKDSQSKLLLAAVSVEKAATSRQNICTLPMSILPISCA